MPVVILDQVLEQRRREEEARAQLNYQKAETSGMTGEAAPQDADDPSNTPFVRRERKVGRNEPCPCGSGKKYKSCHGKLS